jgi:hypothetical protein
MRSVDVSNIVWGLFEHRNRFYIHTTKNGTLATFSVEGQTLQSLLVYLEKHLDYPNTTLIRYLNSPAKCMGSERIAKRVKETMTQLGIPTEAFKAHSLRGATATHLMLNGMEPQWVQSRGGWQSPETMQMYYNRIHQQQDWEAALQGKTDAIKHCFNCVVPALTSPQTEADEGRRRGGRKARHNTDETTGRPWSATGVVLAGDMPKLWPTDQAGSRLHLSPMPHTQTHPMPSNLQRWGPLTTVFFLCQQKVVTLDPGKGLIVDVMGVCEPKSP